MPSLSRYLSEILGASSSHGGAGHEWIYGLIIAGELRGDEGARKVDQDSHRERQVFSTTSMLCKPFVGRWCDLRGFREVYFLTIAVSIVGNLLYMLGAVGGWGFLLVGRALAGVGAANTSCSYAYISKTVPKERQTKVMVLVGMR